MTEPDVTLTDYALAILCAVFAVLLYRREPRGALRRWFLLMFASIGAAALFGGTVHGFFLDPQTIGHRILWPMTMLAIGVTSLSLWNISTHLQFSPPIVRRISFAATALLLLYAILLFTLTTEFVLAVAAYLPAVMFLVSILGVRYAATRRPHILIGLAGFILTLIGAAVQVTGIGLHPVYFNHNALYHLLQAVALVMIYRWASAELLQRRVSHVVAA